MRAERQFSGTMATPEGAQVFHENKALACPTEVNSPIDKIGENSRLSNRAATPANEKPGAAATATGSISLEQFTSAEYRNRAEAATALCHAIADCHPADAAQIMSAVLSELSAGSPLPVFLSAMDDARWWTSFAAPHELKAWALACFEAMRPKVQAAFLAHVQRGASV